MPEPTSVVAMMATAAVVDISAVMASARAEMLAAVMMFADVVATAMMTAAVGTRVCRQWHRQRRCQCRRKYQTSFHADSFL
ncbi:hypothetical protein [Hyphomicrobium sp. 2TAF46]|uniref:hypothetical protein n=1 Tax=Hyphomicrobium sp. 2TAF46 TaxID=3233019 RepID=UPI003F938C77